ncbi:MAG: hypothetical protein N2Z85_03565 [Patescibacteria group bacterium]|nr:hypothetical protein [Patescibacteria group bacterium]
MISKIASLFFDDIENPYSFRFRPRSRYFNRPAYLEQLQTNNIIDRIANTVPKRSMVYPNLVTSGAFISGLYSFFKNRSKRKITKPVLLSSLGGALLGGAIAEAQHRLNLKEHKKALELLGMSE